MLLYRCARYRVCKDHTCEHYTMHKKNSGCEQFCIVDGKCCRCLSINIPKEIYALLLATGEFEEEGR